MRIPGIGHTRTEAGFTLLELMIAMSIGSVIVAGGLSMFMVQTRLDRVNAIRLQVHGSSRYALDQVTRDAMEAGEGMDPTPTFGVLSSADGNGTLPDTLYILRADPETRTHISLPPENDPKQELILDILCDDPVDDLNPGDVVYLANGSSRGIAAVVSVNRRPSGETCDGGPPPDLGDVVFEVTVIDGETHGWPFNGNTGGAAVMRINPSVYYLDLSDTSNPTLIRATRYVGGAWVGAPMAEMITDFQVSLAFVNGTVAVEADDSDSDPENDYDDVTSGLIQYTARADRTDPHLNEGKVYERDYSIRVTPRNPLYSRNLN